MNRLVILYKSKMPSHVDVDVSDTRNEITQVQRDHASKKKTISEPNHNLSPQNFSSTVMTR